MIKKILKFIMLQIIIYPVHASSIEVCNQLFENKSYQAYIEECSEYANDSLVIRWNLAQIYQNGWGCQQNFKTAVYYAEDVANSGLKSAQALLCKNYNIGAGVAIDFQKAFWFCSRASSQGDVSSSLYLAMQYTEGNGTIMNRAKAISIYSSLASNGNSEAQYELSRLLLNEESNSVEGYFWLKQAFQQHYFPATKNVELLVNKVNGCNYLEKFFYSEDSFYQAVNQCELQVSDTGSQRKLDASLTEPHLVFSSDKKAKSWLTDMSSRLVKAIPNSIYAKNELERVKFLTAIQYESVRAGLDPQLLLSMITVLSNFDQRKVSPLGNIGLMQVSKYWTSQINHPNDNLMMTQLNLRYGCTILRYYLEIEHGNMFMALGRYNGGRGSSQFPNAVYSAYKKYWQPTR